MTDVLNDKLLALRMAACSGKVTDAELAEIAVMLELHRVHRLVESDAHQRGNRESAGRRADAHRMHWLITDKAADEWVAALAVVGTEGTVRDAENVRRMYFTIRDGEGFKDVPDRSIIVEQDAKQLEAAALRRPMIKRK